MGVYREWILPRIVNVACGMRTNDPLRQRVCAGLVGEVVEVGFGSGLNVPYYPATVSGVAAVEPGLAPDESVRRWQHRLEPMQKRLFGGCHLTRPVVDLLTAAGFTVAELDVFYEKGAPKFLAAESLGVAVSF